jgi:hypothetical protein
LNILNKILEPTGSPVPGGLKSLQQSLYRGYKYDREAYLVILVRQSFHQTTQHQVGTLTLGNAYTQTGFKHLILEEQKDHHQLRG